MPRRGRKTPRDLRVARRRFFRRTRRAHAFFLPLGGLVSADLEIIFFSSRDRAFRPIHVTSRKWFSTVRQRPEPSTTDGTLILPHSLSLFLFLCLCRWDSGTPRMRVRPRNYIQVSASATRAAEEVRHMDGIYDNGASCR